MTCEWQVTKRPGTPPPATGTSPGSRPNSPRSPRRPATPASPPRAKLDGKYLLPCTGDSLPAADAARLLKGLLDVERGFRDLKSVLEVRPVYDRKQDRIKAHVTLCLLALVLIRVAEHHTGATRRVIGRELDRIHAIDLARTAGTVRQRTEITPDAQAILDACHVPAPQSGPQECIDTHHKPVKTLILSAPQQLSAIL